MQRVVNTRAEESKRLSKRILERKVQQFQASQSLDTQSIDAITKIAADDPITFDEIAQRKKWTYVNKNP